VPDFHAAEFAAVFAHFGVSPSQAQSCYPWSPVFPARWQGQRVVVKRGSPKRPEAVAAWCRHLASMGISVVTPVDLPTDNPVTIAGQAWVVYPWIDGRPYHGTGEDVAAAGDLLGRIHAAPEPDLTLHDLNWHDYPPEEVASDLDGLAERFALHAPGDADRLLARLGPLGSGFDTVTAPALRDTGLPVASVCGDFKASNLVYTVDGPVLVDPDYAVRAPRIHDLALAALLFHTEHSEAPGRRFTGSEWRTFRDAYLARVELTALERRHWPDAIDYILGDEGIWAILDSTEWHVERQRSFLIDLAGTDRHAFPV
jgi:Ser/Thr protein kinase RdoA (MazF antagonist)